MRPNLPRKPGLRKAMKFNFMQRELNIKITLTNVRSGLPKTNVVSIEIGVLSDPN